MESTKPFNHSTNLLIAGWGLFLLSFILPAAGDPGAGRMSGWECARAAFSLMSVSPIAIALHFNNLGIISSVIFWSRAQEGAVWPGFLMIGATLISFLAALCMRELHFNIGFYLWSGSALLIAAGLLYRAGAAKALPVNPLSLRQGDVEATVKSDGM